MFQHYSFVLRFESGGASMFSALQGLLFWTFIIESGGVSVQKLDHPIELDR